MAVAKVQSRQGQNVRDKFFMDFDAATATSSDPYRAQRKEEGVDWLPDLLFIDTDKPAADHGIDQSIFSLGALFEQSDYAFQQA